MINNTHTSHSRHRESGSALLVTIMLTSVMVMFSVILLERVIPYSRQIQGLEGSIYSYYIAKSEVEMARYELKQQKNRGNGGDIDRILPSNVSPLILDLKYPDISKEKQGTYVIVSKHFTLPLRLRLFEKDESVKNFGTDPLDPEYHSLTSYSGGLLFDLSELGGSGSAAFSMDVTTHPDFVSIPGGIDVEFVHVSGGNTTPYFGTLTETPLRPVHGKNIRNALDINRLAGRDSFSYLMNLLGGCHLAQCSLKLRLSETDEFSLPTRFTLSQAIPDLHAVIVADGLTKNAEYHSRIVSLVPNVQSL